VPQPAGHDAGGDGGQSPAQSASDVPHVARADVAAAWQAWRQARGDASDAHCIRHAFREIVA
jgi:hypothetical protein